ncbi:MAG: FkbM family methyltransferase [Nitrospira sp.]|nr:FkbM family methyltransferase [Candidatus Brocadiales bacterium]MBL7048855.1 FkbM family methyltransferase [Nitrospira sp.]
MQANIFNVWVTPMLRTAIKLLYGKRCITLKGDADQPFRFPPGEYPSLLLGVKKTYTQPYHKWMRLLNEDEHILDIGANIGYTTQAFYSILHGKCSIAAFEPIPRNYELLKMNCKVLASENIYPVNSAVGDYNGEAVFFDNTNFGSLSRFAPAMKSNYDKTNEWSNYTKVDVQMITLDTFFDRKNNFSPTFVKIDVEGSGGQVLSGMKHILSQYKPLIICEFHSPEEVKSMKQILEDSGYHGIAFNGYGGMELCTVENSEGEFVHPENPRFKLLEFTKVVYQ